MFGKMKDMALSKGAKVAINKQIEAFGKVTALSLDTKNKSIELDVMLEGELATLHVSVGKYEITGEVGSKKLRVSKISTSRKWINTLVAKYLESKSFDLPDEYAKSIEALI